MATTVKELYEKAFFDNNGGFITIDYMYDTANANQVIFRLIRILQNGNVDVIISDVENGYGLNSFQWGSFYFDVGTSIAYFITKDTTTHVSKLVKKTLSLGQTPSVVSTTEITILSSFSSILPLAMDIYNNEIYLCFIHQDEIHNYTYLYKITLNSQGNGVQAETELCNSIYESNKFYMVSSLKVNSNGDIYLISNAEYGYDGAVIRKFNFSTNIFETVAGTGYDPNTGTPLDGVGTNAGFYSAGAPYALDYQNNFYFLEDSSSCLRKVTLSNYNVSTIAGDVTVSDYVDGSFTEARFPISANGVSILTAGLNNTLYHFSRYTDSQSVQQLKIRAINLNQQTVSTYLDSGAPSSGGGSGGGATPCFSEGTKILCLNEYENSEYFIEIEKLKNGDLVKTYLQGYKKIEKIGKNTMLNDPTYPISTKCMYTLKKDKFPELIEDLTITGNHCVLVDKLSERERNIQRLVWREEKIEDKELLLAALSGNFEQVKDKSKYTYYHFVLENDNKDGKYGVYANGVLCETISENEYNNHTFVSC